MDHNNGWFSVIIGALFMTFARPYGKSLGGKTDYFDGWPPSAEEVRKDARGHTRGAYGVGVACLVWGMWLLLAR